LAGNGASVTGATACSEGNALTAAANAPAVPAPANKVRRDNLEEFEGMK
jgi:hypothetical protein